MSPSMQANLAAQLGVKAKEVVGKWLPEASPGAIQQVCRSTGAGGFNKGLAAVASSACCILNVANLAASLVNTGLMVYTMHQVRSLSCTMGGMVSKLDSMYGRLDNLECTLTGVTGGIHQLESLLLDQQRFMAGMLQEMRAGQAVMLEAQSVTLDQLMHLRSQIDSVDKRLQATLDSLRTCQLHRIQELYSMAAEAYLQFQQASAGHSPHVGTTAGAACQNAWALKVMSESMLRTKLDGSNWDMSSPADIARRQPFVEAICFAAVAADAGDALLRGVPDSSKQRTFARDLVASEIRSLLQACTLYSLAANWRPVLQRYAFLRRGLYKSSGDAAFLDMSGAVPEMPSAHNAADFVWDDGLDELASLLCRSEPLSATDSPSQPRQLEATIHLPTSQLHRGAIAGLRDLGAVPERSTFAKSLQ
ncbi:hypothetical protein WJX72_006029 [[Myrmecia] bisecta]|uniref:Uncharacterized protein n=1 Tax=[Myrmecia] bisecta TaxID=41462 RepID=A0AAW1Q5E4_9CHLO